MKSKVLIILVILLIPKYCDAQIKGLKNKIIWNENRPLVWDDFKGPVNNKSKFKAETASGFFYNVQQISQDELSVSIESYFDPRLSWKKKKVVTDFLLQHEQNHFDISEIYSRLFAKRLAELDLAPIITTLNMIKKEYSRLSKEAMTESSKYDKETDHGRNAEQQKLWSRKVEDMLRETKDYNSERITLRVAPSKRKIIIRTIN